MRKVLLIIAFIGITFGANAQSKKNKERAKSETEYVDDVMKLKKSKETFLYESLVTRYEEVSKKAKGLSKEEKKVVYRETNKRLKKELEKKFSKKDIDKIYVLLKEKRENDKKK